MSSFAPAPKVYASRDLVQIKQAVGGKLGQLRTGGISTFALKLGENVFVTTDPIPAGARVMLNAEGKDIHQVKSAADLSRFVARFKAFDRED